MAHNYKYGMFLYNYENYGKGYLRNAIPFSVDFIERVDEKLVKPSTKGGKLTNCQKLTSTEYGGCLYTASGKHLAGIIDNLSENYTEIRPHIDLEHLALCFKPNIDTIEPNSQYVVKVSPASSKRTMLTGLKEIMMMDAVYNSSYEEYCGCDICPKPIFGCPFWTGKRWKYVIIMEKIAGDVFSYTYSFMNKILNFKKYDKKTIMNSLEKTLTTFWMLGFAHNDLRDGNIMYDMKTNKAKLIDFESIVKLPDDIVEKFRNKMKNDNNADVSDIFDQIYKKPALSLLCLSSHYCERYEDEDNSIYNTDDFFLRIAKTVV